MMMRWFFVAWILSGHITWDGPMTLERCMEEVNVDKRYWVSRRACLPESKLNALLKTWRIE